MPAGSPAVSCTQKNLCDLDLWPMTLTFNRLLEVVKVHVHTKFRQSKNSQVHRLMSYRVERKETAPMLKTILPSLPRAVIIEISQQSSVCLWLRHCWLADRREGRLTCRISSISYGINWRTGLWPDQCQVHYESTWFPVSGEEWSRILFGPSFWWQKKTVEEWMTQLIRCIGGTNVSWLSNWTKELPLWTFKS